MKHRNQDSLRMIAERMPGPEQPSTIPGRFNFPFADNATVYRRNHRFEASVFHNRFVLIVNLATRGTVTIDALPLLLQPDQALLVFPFQKHVLGAFERDKILWLFIEFGTENIQPLLKLKQEPVFLSKSAKIALGWLCALHTTGRAQPPDTNRHILLLDLVLMEMIATLGAMNPGTTLPAAPRPLYNELFRRIDHYLSWNVCRTVRIGKLAGAVGVSASHLQHLFKSHMHMSLGKYMRRYKIAHAVRLLEISDMSLSQIAVECGFDSLYAFSRCFRKENGVLPSLYRQRHAIKRTTNQLLPAITAKRPASRRINPGCARSRRYQS